MNNLLIQTNLEQPWQISQLAESVALPGLMAMMWMLRRRLPHLKTACWMAALGLIFLTDLKWLYPDFHLTHHVIDLQAQLLAGIVLAGYRYDPEKPRADWLYLGLNALPLMAFEGFYGVYLLRPAPYFAVSAVGLATLVATCAWRRRSVQAATIAALGWVAMAALVHWQAYRPAAYLALLGVFAMAALNFVRELPAGSVGKRVMLAGTGLWMLSYALHPWVFHHAGMWQFTGTIWEMQKYLVAIGMLLLLLEDQVAAKEWLAMHDQLTRIGNRRKLDRWMEAKLALASEGLGGLAVVVLNVEGMRALNGAHGNRMGDLLLAEVAERLDNCATPSMELAARLDGDTFVLASLNVWDDDDLEVLLVRVHESLRAPAAIKGKQIPIEVTCGHAVYPFDAIGARPGQACARMLDVAAERLFESRRSRQVLEFA